MTDAGYADNLVLLENASPHVKSQLYSLDQTAGGIGLSVNINRTEFIFKQEGAIFKPLKLFGQLTYLGSNILSTESDVNISLAKAWTVTDKLSVI